MSVDHEKYTLVIVDEYSRYTWVYFLRKKSHAAEMIMSFIRMVENQNDVKIIDFSYTPEQNSVAEGKNRTLIEAARTMLNGSDRWSKDQHIKLVNIIGDPGKDLLTRSMAAKLELPQLVNVMFGLTFLSEIEPKPRSERTKARECADEKGISIFQEQCTRNLLKKYEISDSFSMKTPMVPPNNLGLDLAGQSKRTTSNGCKKNSQLVAMYSVEAEYVAVGSCFANILWMKSQLSDYDIHYKMVPIFCDNTSAIAISKNPVLHSRTKHIDIRYHFIRDHILKGDIELHFIPTKYQLVNIFTKPLDEPTFTRMKADDEWQEALTLDFKTFITSIGLDYNNDEYVAHPSPEAVKAELANIVTNPNYLDKTSVLKNSFLVA
ncbi:retrovirus-related pol polyprotein from transposon TNT 1-94 [Tanacetum coccineum]|uniref:Retrovirus-related pol polyprotein from transposon TNT 1-94 n=1 Tax=Tanacetum coccineum TaxID=301880 RepID=A0ABQ5G4G1_9ASTR